MSPDVIGTVIAVFGASATVLGGVWVMLTSMHRGVDKRFDRVDTRFERIESAVNARFEKVDGALADVRGELGEVKIAIARLEGPRLIPAR